MHVNSINQAVQALQAGHVIAYPTEAVFGVGCDPDNPQALEALLELKQRPKEKGLILIAANYQQLQDYIDESQLTDEQIKQVKSTWPGPVTWVMPVKARVLDLVTGQFDSVAVRVTDHPLVQELCLAYGKPITSTSANLTGQPPCRTQDEVEAQLGSQQVTILSGKVGGLEKPTEIRDARSTQVLRKG
ncbi:MAG: L-threonylcarbamoyladenylate synthase [Vibrio sp.]